MNIWRLCIFAFIWIIALVAAILIFDYAADKLMADKEFGKGKETILDDRFSRISLQSMTELCRLYVPESCQENGRFWLAERHGYGT